MKTKKFLALTAALLTISCMSANISADTLTERDRLKYLLSDSGEDKGLYSGWTKKGDKHYYYKNGVMKKNCWIMSGGERKYFLQADGSRAKGKVTVLGVEYEFDENGVIIPDEWGLTLTAKNVTPTSLTVVFTQSGGDPTGELGSGSYYTLEQYKNGQWTAAQMLPQEYELAWTDEGWIISNDNSVEFEHKWNWLYGKLPAGKYRIGKEIMDWREPGDYDEKMYYAYFEIYPPLEPLTDEAESKLWEDFAAYRSDLRGESLTGEDIYVDTYYGTYNGCEVVTMWIKDVPFTEDVKYVTVGGYTFSLSSGSFDIMLHKDSDFIDIKTAYSKGYLSDKDIAAMYYYKQNRQLIHKYANS